jgi:23S rRNA (pseudouridine1915-N3)-methyltransferase
MQIVIIAIGKESSAELSKLQTIYEQRLQPHTKIVWKLLPASRAPDTEQVRAQDSNQIMAQLKSNDVVILLDERGEQMTNDQFATTFERLAGVQGRLVFVIGGAFGVTDTVRERAQFVWSLSKLVFPHQLVRVMLLEQVYRTFMVQKSHPYHHN